jgi:hypothetical protein
LISAHAVSPLSKFTSQPCSIFTSDKAKHTAARRTYVGVLDTASGRQSSICCFEQTKNGSDWSNITKLSTPTVSSLPIVLIDGLKATKDGSSDPDTYDIIVVYEDGTVQCLDKRLGSTIWTRSLVAGLNRKNKYETQTIRHAFLTTADELQSLLDKRKDVLWRMLPYGNQDKTRLEHHTVLCAISAGDSKVASDIILSAIAPRKPSLTNIDNPIHNLDVWKLPSTLFSNVSPSSITWSLNSQAGLLQVASPSALVSLTLTGNTAQVASILEQSLTSGSHVAVSPSAVLAATNLGYSIFDLKFECVLDQRPFATGLALSKKRKRLSEEQPSVIQPVFVQYFRKSHLALAQQGQEILLIHIDPGSHKSKGGSLLIDLIRNGIATATTDGQSGHKVVEQNGDSLPTQSTSQHPWNTKQKKFEELVANGETRKFDRLFAREVGITLKVLNEQSDEVEWFFVKSGQRQQLKAHSIYRQKALFALRCIFKRVSTLALSKQSTFGLQKRPILSINFFPPNVFRWLMWSNQLNADLVQQAFSQDSETSNFITPVGPGDVINAIANFDPFLKLLHDYIKINVCLDLFELVHIMKLMVHSPDESDIRTPEGLLTNGDESYLANGAVDTFIEGETANALQAIDVAMMDLENGVDEREAAFHKALVRLNDFPQPRIVDAFQEVLAQHELVSLTQILKTQLAGGGWTSLYVDGARDDFENSINDVSIISRLLGCCVDAIGINGWLTSGNSTVAIDEVFDSLSAEISATLEGVHEAKFMEATLDGFLRYSYQLKQLKVERGSRKTPISSALDKPELPMNLKPANAISFSRVTSGGIVKPRSTRDIGQQLSMKVPKYSFERIRL